MDLKLPITLSIELSDDIVNASALLDLASGEIQRVVYEDYDADAQGLPFERRDYEFTSGTLTHGGRDVEFGVELNRTTAQFSVTANELLEIKMRAAALFGGMSAKDMLKRTGS